MILCLLLLGDGLFQGGLATARGSFFVDGWRVWGNATIVDGAHISTQLIPVRLTFEGSQTLAICPESSILVKAKNITVEKGCAQFQKNGALVFSAPFIQGRAAAATESDLKRAALLDDQLHFLRETHPMSQRP